jgi:hypothetical protein
MEYLRIYQKKAFSEIPNPLVLRVLSEIPKPRALR